MATTVTLYMKDQCLLCDEAKTILQMLQEEHAFHLEEVNIYNDEQLLEKYHLYIPVIKIADKEILSNNIDFSYIESTLQQQFSRIKMKDQKNEF